MTLKPRQVNTLPSVPLSGRQRVREYMRWLMKPKPTLTELTPLHFGSTDATDCFEAGLECPEHALKIYKSDQHFRYLLVHQVSFK